MDGLLVLYSGVGVSGTGVVTSVRISWKYTVLVIGISKPVLLLVVEVAVA